MANRFASGKIALAECDRCALTYELHELQEEIVKGNPNGLKVCPSCFDPDHPQLHLGEYPVDDPQALRDPRPEKGLDDSREITGTGGLSVEDYIANTLHR
jgi:hypothetical protein